MKALALALALYWPIVLAQEPERIRCHGDQCLILKADLQMLFTEYQKLAQHVMELRALCGWEGKP